jgi:hypothetical protein
MPVPPGWIVGALGTTVGLTLTASTLFLSTRTVAVADPSMAAAPARPVGVTLIREIGGRAPTPILEPVTPTAIPTRAGLVSLFPSASAGAADGAARPEGASTGAAGSAASARPSVPQTSSGVSPRPEGIPSALIQAAPLSSSSADPEKVADDQAARRPSGSDGPTPMPPRSKAGALRAAATAQPVPPAKTTVPTTARQQPSGQHVVEPSRPTPTASGRFTPVHVSQSGAFSGGQRRPAPPAVVPVGPPFPPPFVPAQGCPRPGC